MCGAPCPSPLLAEEGSEKPSAQLLPPTRGLPGSVRLGDPLMSDEGDTAEAAPRVS